MYTVKSREPLCYSPLTLPSPLTFQDNLECRVFQAVLVQQDLQVPRVNQAARVLLG